MPNTVRVPDKLFAGDFSDVIVPASGDNGRALVWDSANQRAVWAVVTAVPGGASGQVQYNNGGAFAGHSGFTYDGAGKVTLSVALVAPAWRPASDSMNGLQIQDATGLAVVTVDTTNRLVIPKGYIKWNTTAGDLVGLDFFQAGNFGFRVRPITTVGTGLGALVFYDTTGGTEVERARFNLTGGFSTTGGTAIFRSDVHIGDVGDSTAKTMVFPKLFNDAVILRTFRNDAFGYADRVALTSGTISGSGVGIAYLRLRDTYLAVGHETPTALLDIAASTTARSSLRIRTGTAPTTPNAGDIWYPTSGRLSIYRATTEIIASGIQATGGAASASVLYTATEQTMLQAVYDAARAFGLLT